jgi:hypothetical protein
MDAGGNPPLHGDDFLGLSPEALDPASGRFQQESAALQAQLKEVEQEIAAIRNTVYGLSVIYGEQAVSHELLEQVRPVRSKQRGLTDACRVVLCKAARPCSVTTICKLVDAVDPFLLLHHRNPRASVMTILRNLANRGQVARSAINGRSVWEWVGSAADSKNSLP